MKPNKYIKSNILNSILKFAIEGKLVTQSPETADDFIQICRDKKKLFGNVKSAKKTIDFDKPFNIPRNWRWEKLDNLIYISTGASFKKESAITSPKNGYIRVLRGGNVLNLDYSFFDNDLFIPRNLVSDDIILRENDLISPSVTSIENIGKISCIKEKVDNVTAGGFVFIFRPFVNNRIFSELFSLFFSSPLFSATLKSITKKSGEAFYNLNKELLRNLWFPIPPLSEQEKIVNKFHQLKPLIDKYEEFERERENIDVNLMPLIEKSILKHAIHGKLSVQKPTDEPVGLLINKIEKEKNVLIKEKKIKKDIEINPINKSEIESYPTSWAFMRLGEICRLINGEEIKGKSYPYLEAKYLRGKIKPTILTAGKFVKKGEKVILVDGENSGEVFIIPEDGYLGSTFKILFVVNSLNFKYIKLFLKLKQDNFKNSKKGAAIPHLNKDTFFNTLVPIPPIQEQERIVNKIEKLMLITNLIN